MFSQVVNLPNKGSKKHPLGDTIQVKWSVECGPKLLVERYTHSVENLPEALGLTAGALPT